MLLFLAVMPVAHPGIPGKVQTHPASSQCVGCNETSVHLVSSFFHAFFVLFYDTGFPEPPARKPQLLDPK